MSSHYVLREVCPVILFWSPAFVGFHLGYTAPLPDWLVLGVDFYVSSEYGIGRYSGSDILPFRPELMVNQRLVRVDSTRSPYDWFRMPREITHVTTRSFHLHRIAIRIIPRLVDANIRARFSIARTCSRSKGLVVIISIANELNTRSVIDQS